MGKSMDCEMICITEEDFEMAKEINSCISEQRPFCEDGVKYIIMAVSSYWEGEHRMVFRYSLDEIC